jgi:hypothetical protein
VRAGGGGGGRFGAVVFARVFFCRARVRFCFFPGTRGHPLMAKTLTLTLTLTLTRGWVTCPDTVAGESFLKRRGSGSGGCVGVRDAVFGNSDINISISLAIHTALTRRTRGRRDALARARFRVRVLLFRVPFLTQRRVGGQNAWRNVYRGMKSIDDYDFASGGEDADWKTLQVRTSPSSSLVVRFVSAMVP